MSGVLKYVCAAAAFGALLVGCTQSTPPPAPVPTESHGVGDTVSISPAVSITLASAGAKPAGVSSSAPASATWLAFEVRNTSDASLTLVGRPTRPVVTDASGAPVTVGQASARIEGGGGGWGISAAKLGEPYLSPGGVLLTAFELRPGEGSAAPQRPLTVVYAPTRESSAEFEVP